MRLCEVFCVGQGVPGSQSYTVPPRAESSAKRQSLQSHTDASQVAIQCIALYLAGSAAWPHSSASYLASTCILAVATMQDAVQKELSESKKTRHTEQQAANKKPKLSSEPSRRKAFLPTSKQPSVSKTSTGSQTQGKGRQVGDYDRPWRAYMKAGGSNKGSEQQQKQAEPTPLARSAVAPATRAKVLSCPATFHQTCTCRCIDNKHYFNLPIVSCTEWFAIAASTRSCKARCKLYVSCRPRPGCQSIDMRWKRRSEKKRRDSWSLYRGVI